MNAEIYGLENLGIITKIDFSPIVPILKPGKSIHCADYIKHLFVTAIYI